MHCAASLACFARQSVLRVQRGHRRTFGSFCITTAFAAAALAACSRTPKPASHRDTTTIAARPAVGDFIPAFRVATLTGDSASFGGREKRPVTFVNLWATFCGPCVREFPLLDSLQSKFAPRGLRVLAISSDLLDGPVNAFMMARGSEFSIGRDPDAKFSRAFGDGELPQNVLLSSEGRILWRGDFGERIPPLLTAVIDSVLLAQ
jgi:thiol-disulfide isomerase/thioredoxin